MQLPDHTQGSQSVAVNLMAGVLMLAFAAGIAYMAWQGPNPDSVFRAFRSPFMLYAMAAVGVPLFLFLGLLGVRKSWLLARLRTH